MKKRKNNIWLTIGVIVICVLCFTGFLPVRLSSKTKNSGLPMFRHLSSNLPVNNPSPDPFVQGIAAGSAPQQKYIHAQIK